MKKLVIQPPRLPNEASAVISSLPQGELGAESGHHNLVITGRRYSAHTVSHVVFVGCHFQGVAFDRMQLPYLDMGDARFEECDLANTSCPKVIFNRVEMLGCRLLGFKANEGYFKNTVIRECNGSLAQFRFCSFKAVLFEDCNLHGADFQNSDLRGVIFKNCDLSEAQMSFAKLDGADLRGSKIDGLQVGVDNLKGAIVEPFQAAYFATLLGLQVRWTDSEN